MISILKKVGVFLFAFTALSSKSQYMNVQREKLNYEVLNVKLSEDALEIEGWATMPYTQHFYNANTHQFELELQSKDDYFTIDSELTNYDLTQQMSYLGNKKCAPGVINTTTCDFYHQNVGFKFKIPLSMLKSDQNYQLYLKMHAKQSAKKYRIPLFYTSYNQTHIVNDDIQYSIQSDFSHIKFSVFAHTLLARSGPDPKTEAVSVGTHCSYYFENTWYVKENATFNTIYDIATYNGIITYFKVRAVPYGCIGDRLRVVEAKPNEGHFIYVPSTHVNYIGNPMTIYVKSLDHKPSLYVEDVELNQYDNYNPYDYASAFDKKDGNLDNKINVTSSNVQMHIPGSYTTCYEVYNSKNQKAQACGNVIVIKIPTKKRFVSSFTIHDTILKRWQREELKLKLKSEKYLIQENLNP